MKSADEKQIKSHYRRLSLTHHPDKVTLDPEQNITADIVNERWVEYTKAFKALTDDEVRNNYLQYGHPDGKQSFSMGIALPKLLVSEGNGKYVLALYAALLGIILPTLVGRWWYGSQSLTKDGVLVASAGHIFQEFGPDMNERNIVRALSKGEEYRLILKGNKADNGASKVEQRILQDNEGSPSVLNAKDRSKLAQLEEGARRKALSLLWAYLGRIELDDATLNAGEPGVFYRKWAELIYFLEKYEVAPTAFQLNEAYTSIALAYGVTEPVLSGFRTSQRIIQAVAPDASPLLQLPNITPAIARIIEGENFRKHLTVQEFMNLSMSERRKRAVGPNLLSEHQLKGAVAVAGQLPALKVEKAFFKVVGENFVTPSSLVQFVIKARVVPPGTQDVSPVKEADLDDIDPEEGDLDALHGRKDEEKNGKQVQPPLAHAPYFARDHSPRWHVFLADSKQGKIAVPPFTFRTFDKPLFSEDGKPTLNVQTLKMQFGAPPQAGRYTFVMHLVCDSYVGFDTKSEVTLVVEPASKAEKVHEEEEISEPEEGMQTRISDQRHPSPVQANQKSNADTLAGQMSALKGGANSGSRRSKPAEDSSDDESGTDDEESESETDTDTDTDEE